MLDRNEVNVLTLPCLILAHPNLKQQSLLARAFRRLGWDVYLAQNGPEARRLARMMDADMVILHAEVPGESGWLTCDKLTREHPRTRVFLVSDDFNKRSQELADFVGASKLLSPTESIAPLIEQLLGATVHAAG